MQSDDSGFSPSERSSASPPTADRKSLPDWVPYVAPMLVFLAFTQAEASFATGSDNRADPSLYPWLYIVKILATTATVLAFRSTWRDFQPIPRPGVWLLAIFVGLLAIVVWIGLDQRYPALPFLGGGRSEFNPNGIPSDWQRIGFLISRFFGLVVLVPVVEELFWRSFLVRWLTDPEFERLPVGSATWKSGAIVSILFALAHPEWLPALLTGLAWIWLLRTTRNLSACLISHVAANLALGIYVLATGDWRYW